MFQLGLVSISFRALSPSQIIQAVKDNGLTCVEWGSDVHAPVTDLEKVRKIREECDKNGITTCSYGTYFKIGVNAAEEIYPYVEAAKILGTNILRLWAGNKGSEEYTEEEKQAFLAECKTLAEIARAENVIFCTECHNNTFTDRLPGCIEMLDAVSSPHFKTYWQPNQFRTREENIRYAASVADQTTVVHVFNWLGTEKFPLIEGKEVWQEYLKYFRNVPLLLEFMPDNQLETLECEANALKAIAETIR